MTAISPSILKSEISPNIHQLLVQNKSLLSQRDFSSFYTAPKLRINNKSHSLLSQSIICDRINYGPPNNLIVDPPSSGEDSENEQSALLSPSISDVTQNIFDEKLYVTVKELSEIPKNSPPALIFSNIDFTTNALDLKAQLEFCKPETKISSIKIFEKNSIRTAYIEFENLSSAQEIYSFLSKKVPLNHQGLKIDIKWAYDKSKSGEAWVAVILRGIPPDSKVQSVFANCTFKGEKVRYVTVPKQIKGQWCCYAIMENIEEAEKLCFRMNGHSFSNNKKLRAHIHPDSNLIRPDKKKSHHNIFSNLEIYCPQLKKPLLEAQSQNNFSKVNSSPNKMLKMCAEPAKIISAPQESSSEQPKALKIKEKKTDYRSDLFRRLLESPEEEPIKDDKIPDVIKGLLSNTGISNSVEKPKDIIHTPSIDKDNSPKVDPIIPEKKTTGLVIVNNRKENMQKEHVSNIENPYYVVIPIPSKKSPEIQPNISFSKEKSHHSSENSHRHEKHKSRSRSKSSHRSYHKHRSKSRHRSRSRSYHKEHREYREISRRK